MYDLTIIGGGLVGLAAAYHALRSGASVALIDREDEGKASAAGAGILTPATVRNSTDGWWRDFAFPACHYYPELVQQLALDGEEDTGYYACGLLHVATSDAEAHELHALAQTIEANKRLGAPMVAGIELLDARAAQALFPPLGDFPATLHVTGPCRIDGRQLMTSLRRAGDRRGLVVHRESATELLVASGVVRGVRLASGAQVASRSVILAGGAWSGSFASELGITIPVTPQRGQIVHLRVEERETNDWPVVMGFYSHYMLSFDGGRVVVGATRESGSGFDPRVTAAGVHEVLGEGLRIAPGLAAAELLEVRVGLRPATPDGLPVLGRAPAVDGVVVATGHGPSGLQLGPYSGRVAAELALGNAVNVDLSALDPGRFTA